MDSVRFGRALGFGARAAAKTLVTAVDAATATNPSANGKSKQREEAVLSQGAQADATIAKSEASGVRLAQHTARTITQFQQTRRGLKEGSKQFRKAAWGPVVKLSGVLWLELTGVFFGIFAVFAANGAWKTREALHDVTGSRDAYVRFLLSVAMAAIFGYFCASSFVRANRRSKGN